MPSSDAELDALLAPLLMRRTRFIACEKQPDEPLLATRFGGHPAGLRGEPWPMCTCGDPMRFVGQISGADAPLFVSWFQLATFFCCSGLCRCDEQSFSGPERPWRGWCFRAYPSSRDDLETLLIYADWLQARGDPNGDLIALAYAIATARDPDARRELQGAVIRCLLAHPDLDEPAAWDGARLDADRDEFALLALPDAEVEFYAEGFVRPVRELSLPTLISIEEPAPILRPRLEPLARRPRVEQAAERLTRHATQVSERATAYPPRPRNDGLALGGWAYWQSFRDETPACPRCGRAMELFVQWGFSSALDATWGDAGTLFSFVCEEHRDEYALRMHG